MSNTKLTQMPPADLPLSGAELAYVVQGGNSRQVPVSELSGRVLGEPFTISGPHTMGEADNGQTLILPVTQVLTIDIGLPVGFGCAIKGDFTYAGTATVTDERDAGALYPWCAIVQTGTDTYDLVGSKV